MENGKWKIKFKKLAAGTIPASNYGIDRQPVSAAARLNYIIPPDSVFLFSILNSQFSILSNFQDFSKNFHRGYCFWETMVV